MTVKTFVFLAIAMFLLQIFPGALDAQKNAETPKTTPEKFIDLASELIETGKYFPSIDLLKLMLKTFPNTNLSNHN